MCRRKKSGLRGGSCSALRTDKRDSAECSVDPVGNSRGACTRGGLGNVKDLM